jgi:hypothetical protein
MKRLLAAAFLMLAGCSGLEATSHGVALAAGGGNTDAAHACQHWGYLNLQGSDGTTFKNEGQCVSYAARGGTLGGVSACTYTPGNTGCLNFNNATASVGPDTGNSVTLTGTISFVSTCSSGECYQSIFPNSLATGGGTYVEKNSSGTVISSGTFQVANTPGLFEGLFELEYVDSSGKNVSSCAAATGSRTVLVGATLIDSNPTVAPQYVEIGGRTGAFTLTGAEVTALIGSDWYFGEVPTAAFNITC